MADGRAVNGMFARIAGVYDLLNRVLSMGIDQSWRKELADQVPSGPKNLVLDLAAGTLDVAIKIAAKLPGSRVCALDFCLPMLRRGRRKLHGQKIYSCGGDAKALPLPDKSVDCVTIAFGIRNISPRNDALEEMLRVIVPGGKVAILEFGSGKERICGGVYNFYLSHILPRIGSLLARDKGAYEYLARTVKEFPSAETLAREMRAAGFSDVGWKKLTGGIVCLHWGFRPGS